jgi:hypothetical protein
METQDLHSAWISVLFGVAVVWVGVPPVSALCPVGFSPQDFKEIQKVIGRQCGGELSLIFPRDIRRDSGITLVLGNQSD